ncbi:ubiquitin specific protease 2-like protein [Dinothrombium tinctorium]|uniref:Ubiquitin carboxyl-terminal hydrolase n=1 Tax=Dinothrombium tinctorium TaxID=1965070 RepID=A0A3S3QB65_9ACAR|nr:ubiquitin specific protease 2-like protein [Dinothrombium tinctorium]
MPELTTYSSSSSSSSVLGSSYLRSSLSSTSGDYKPFTSSTLSSSSPSSYFSHKSRSSYDLSTRYYSSSASSREPSINSSALYSLSSTSNYRPPTSNRYLGLSSSPCSVTLTRYNPRRSSLDYNDSDNESICSSKSVSSSSYLYSPLSRRRKYNVKSDECNGYLKLPPNICGLTNLGNTCYMNSVLQALYATQVFRNYVIKNQRYSLMSALSNLFQEMDAPENTTLAPSVFRSHFTRYQPKFRGYDQQDAQEFLRYLITGLHEEVNETKHRPKPPIMKSPNSPTEAWQQMKMIDDSPFVDMLVGQLSSVIQCTQCGNKSTCWDPFWDLSLPLPRNMSECTVEQCLREFTALEELSPGEHAVRICEKCKRQTQSTKQLSIEKAPPVLILHLKRFSNEGYKLSVPRVVPNDKLFVKSRYYSLYAIVSHHGHSSRSGHYTSYCAHSSKWFLFNDDKVTEMKNFTPSDIQDAYILFYVENNYSSRL